MSPLDRSPIRISGTRGLATNHRPGALAALAKLDSLTSVLGRDEELGREIDRLRIAAAARR